MLHLQFIGAPCADGVRCVCDPVGLPVEQAPRVAEGLLAVRELLRAQMSLFHFIYLIPFHSDSIPISFFQSATL